MMSMKMLAIVLMLEFIKEFIMEDERLKLLNALFDRIAESATIEDLQAMIMAYDEADDESTPLAESSSCIH